MTGRPAPAPASLSSWLLMVSAGGALLSSLPIRGPARSLRLLGVCLAVASAGEVLAIRGTRTLRHHSRPQVGGLPLLVPLGWYAFVAPAYSLAQAAAGDQGPLAVAAATAVLAAATDVATDPWGLASGYWEWRDGGPFMPDVVGPNGVAGIPADNFVGWLVIPGAVALLGEAGRPAGEAVAARRRRARLLVAWLQLGLGGLWWGLRERRWRLLGGAAGVLLGAGAGAWLAAGRGPDRPGT